MTTMNRADIEARHLTLTQSVLEQIEELRASGELELKTEPRCHVCCEAESKNLINRLIAKGLTNREIAECCAGINTRRTENGDERLIRAYNVRWHRREHFPIQRPVDAAYREIVERRAEEVNLDHINGVGHAVVPLAVMETIMFKGFEHITDEDTVVTVKEALDAAVKLQDLINKDANSRKMADVLYMMDRIITAAQEFIPSEQHADFVARVEGRQAMSALTEQAVAVVSGQTAREFAPKTTRDEDDTL